jgi:hypothetical protein
MRRGHAQLVRQCFAESPLIWAGDGRHYVREITSEPQAQAAALALETPNDIAAFFAQHAGQFGGRRPKYRGFVVHDKDGSVDGTILVERDGFCWKPLGVTWPRGRKRPTKGLKAAVQSLCAQEGVCGVKPGEHTGHVNRSTLGRLNCDSRTHFNTVRQLPIGRPSSGKTKRPTTKMRRQMPVQLFALPKSAMSARNKLRLPRGVDGAYPMDTMARARNARSRAISELNAGRLDLSEARTIFARTEAFSRQMTQRGIPGWNALQSRVITGSRGRYRSEAPSGRYAAAANVLPSRDRHGRFLPRRKAAPGLLEHRKGSGGPLPSRTRTGQFVAEKRRAPALANRQGLLNRILFGKVNRKSSGCGCRNGGTVGRANCGCGGPCCGPGKKKRTL